MFFERRFFFGCVQKNFEDNQLCFRRERRGRKTNPIRWQLQLRNVSDARRNPSGHFQRPVGRLISFDLLTQGTPAAFAPFWRLGDPGGPHKRGAAES